MQFLRLLYKDVWNDVCLGEWRSATVNICVSVAWPNQLGMFHLGLKYCASLFLSWSSEGVSWPAVERVDFTFIGWDNQGNFGITSWCFRISSIEICLYELGYLTAYPLQGYALSSSNNTLYLAHLCVMHIPGIPLLWWVQWCVYLVFHINASIHYGFQFDVVHDHRNAALYDLVLPSTDIVFKTGQYFKTFNTKLPNIKQSFFPPQFYVCE